MEKANKFMITHTYKNSSVFQQNIRHVKDNEKKNAAAISRFSFQGKKKSVFFTQQNF